MTCHRIAVLEMGLWSYKHLLACKYPQQMPAAIEAKFEGVISRLMLILDSVQMTERDPVRYIQPLIRLECLTLARDFSEERCLSYCR